MRILVLATAIAAALAGTIGPAAACSCARPSGSLADYRAQLIAQSEAAFVGRVRSVRTVDGGGPALGSQSQVLAEIAVSKALKGHISRISFVVTDDGDPGASCTLKTVLRDALRSGLELTLVSDRSIRIDGVRARRAGRRARGVARGEH